MYNGSEFFVAAPPAAPGFYTVVGSDMSPARNVVVQHGPPMNLGPHSTGSTDDLHINDLSPGSHRTPPASHDDMEDEDWNVLCKKIDSCVRLDTQFFEYPKQELFTTPPTSGSIDDDELTGTKVFLGGMRFEVVQMGRHLIRWLLSAACGVTLSPNRILIHRKSRNGKLAAPTGCASVYVATEEDVMKLIGMNQRIFCGEKGIHVASSASKMNELIQHKVILDMTDGRVRGPTHPMIIERAYSGTTTPHSSQSPTPNGSTDSLVELAGPTSTGTSLQGSFAEPGARSLTTPSAVPVADHPLYRRYEGDAKAQPGILKDTTNTLTNPTELFVGGLCYEATRTFVAWMFTVLMDVKLHPLNVTLYSDPQTGTKRGCAQVRVEESDFAAAVGFTRRLLCDPHGVYVAETPQQIIQIQQNRERNETGARGPSHAVVIEKRRNTSSAHHRSGHHTPNGSTTSTGTLPNSSFAPPPPPPQYAGLVVGGSLPPWAAPPPAPGAVFHAPMNGQPGMPFVILPYTAPANSAPSSTQQS